MNTMTEIERIRMLKSLYSAMAEIEEHVVSDSHSEEGRTSETPQQDNRIRHLTKEIAILELEIAKTTNEMNLEEKTMHECDVERMKIARKMMELDNVIFFKSGRHHMDNFTSKESTHYQTNHKPDTNGVYPAITSFKQKLYLTSLSFFYDGSNDVIQKIKEEALDEQLKLDKDWVAFQTAYEKSKKSYASLVAKIAELQKTVETKKLLIRQYNGKN
jgi:hypothetical protein